MKTQNTTHTPGRTRQQWELWPNYTNTEICVGAVQPHSNLVCAAAVVPYTDKEEGFAVANLIAAAPELLAALIDVLGDRDGDGDGCCRFCGRDLSEAEDEMFCTADDCAGFMARTAIARATGKGQP